MILFTGIIGLFESPFHGRTEDGCFTEGIGGSMPMGCSSKVSGKWAVGSSLLDDCGNLKLPVLGVLCPFLCPREEAAIDGLNSEDGLSMDPEDGMALCLD